MSKIVRYWRYAFPFVWRLWRSGETSYSGMRLLWLALTGRGR